MKFKPGNEVTAVYHHPHQRPMGRHVLLLKVTKVGRKYLHGITLYVNSEGIVREGHNTKVNIKESVIYPELRLDLRDAEFKYRENYRQWQNRKQSKRNEIKRDFWDYMQKRLGEWEVDNPMPQPPEFPTQEAEDE